MSYLSAPRKRRRYNPLSGALMLVVVMVASLLLWLGLAVVATWFWGLIT